MCAKVEADYLGAISDTLMLAKATAVGEEASNAMYGFAACAGVGGVAIALYLLNSKRASTKTGQNWTRV